MTALLTRAELDEATCQAPGCDCGGELVLRSRCHPDAPTWVHYHRGVATVKCAECDTPLARLAVADRGNLTEDQR